MSRRQTATHAAARSVVTRWSSTVTIPWSVWVSRSHRQVRLDAAPSGTSAHGYAETTTATIANLKATRGINRKLPEIPLTNRDRRCEWIRCCLPAGPTGQGESALASERWISDSGPPDLPVPFSPAFEPCEDDPPRGTGWHRRTRRSPRAHRGGRTAYHDRCR